MENRTNIKTNPVSEREREREQTEKVKLYPSLCTLVGVRLWPNTVYSRNNIKTIKKHASYISENISSFRPVASV